MKEERKLRWKLLFWLLVILGGFVVFFAMQGRLSEAWNTLRLQSEGTLFEQTEEQKTGQETASQNETESFQSKGNAIEGQLEPIQPYELTLNERTTGYELPDLEAQVAWVLPSGSAVTVIGKGTFDDTSWLQVKAGEEYGWLLQQ